MTRGSRLAWVRCKLWSGVENRMRVPGSREVHGGAVQQHVPAPTGPKQSQHSNPRSTPPPLTHTLVHAAAAVLQHHTHQARRTHHLQPRQHRNAPICQCGARGRAGPMRGCVVASATGAHMSASDLTNARSAHSRQASSIHWAATHPSLHPPGPRGSHPRSAPAPASAAAAKHSAAGLLRKVWEATDSSIPATHGQPPVEQERCSQMAAAVTGQSTMVRVLSAGFAAFKSGGYQLASEL